MDKTLQENNGALHAKIAGNEKVSVFGSYRMLDETKIKALPEDEKKVVDETMTASRKNALATVAIFPCFMLVCYLLLILYFKAKGGYHAQELATAPDTLAEPAVVVRWRWTNWQLFDAFRKGFADYAGEAFSRFRMVRNSSRTSLVWRSSEAMKRSPALRSSRASHPSRRASFSCSSGSAGSSSRERLCTMRRRLSTSRKKSKPLQNRTRDRTKLGVARGFSAHVFVRQCWKLPGIAAERAE